MNDHRVRRRHDDSLLVRATADELVLLDTGSNRVHQLNATARFIWEACAEPTTPQAIVAALTQAFDVDEATAERDLVKTLSLMRKLGLLADG